MSPSSVNMSMLSSSPRRSALPAPWLANRSDRMKVLCCALMGMLICMDPHVKPAGRRGQHRRVVQDQQRVVVVGGVADVDRLLAAVGRRRAVDGDRPVVVQGAGGTVLVASSKLSQKMRPGRVEQGLPTPAAPSLVPAPPVAPATPLVPAPPEVPARPIPALPARPPAPEPPPEVPARPVVPLPAAPSPAAPPVPPLPVAVDPALPALPALPGGARRARIRRSPPRRSEPPPLPAQPIPDTKSRDASSVVQANPVRRKP